MNIVADTETYFRHVAAVGLPPELVSRPTAIGWKMADANEVFTFMGNRFYERRALQAHVARVDDERVIGTAYYPEEIIRGIHLVKAMQRRPGSTDKLGLDHVDFLVDDLQHAQSAIGAWAMESVLETEVTSEMESNDRHQWLSVRFGPQQMYEAKFVDHLILEVGEAELAEARNTILRGLTKQPE